MVPHPGGGTTYGRLLSELWVTLPHRPLFSRPVRPMIRLALYALLSGLTLAAGAQVLTSAQQAAEQIKVRQIAQCVTVNQVAPGTCQMPR